MALLSPPPKAGSSPKSISVGSPIVPVLTFRGWFLRLFLYNHMIVTTDVTLMSCKEHNVWVTLRFTDNEDAYTYSGRTHIDT